MTTAYLGGQPITLTIPLTDSEGAALSVASVEYRLVNQDEVELVAKTPVTGFSVGDDSIVVSIPSNLNTVTAPNVRELRQVELYVTTDSGVVKISREYIIEAEEVLVEAVNSFQNYPTAMIVAMDLNDIPGWNDATKAERISALIRARQHIGRLTFRYVFDDYQDIIDATLGVSDITLATQSQWNSLPAQFVSALRRAQILEADLILNGDEIGDIRRDGLMSMTVGESKQFFRPVKPIEMPIGKRAMRELGKWVLTRRRLVRT